MSRACSPTLYITQTFVNIQKRKTPKGSPRKRPRANPTENYMVPMSKELNAMQTRVSRVALLWLSLQISLTTCIPLSARDVVTAGPEGNLTPLKRWRDTVGTATQVWARGAASENDIFNTDRSGPISSVYRSTLAAHASTPCVPGGEDKCEVGVDGFGTVGEVHFVFDSKRANIKGRSTQVMVACRCLTQECENATLIRPINVFTKDETGKEINTGRRMCIYEAVDDKYTDCHTELLRVTYRERDHGPNYRRGDDAFNYTVSDPNFGVWNSAGQVGWTRDCLDSTIESLDVMNLSALNSDNLNFNVHETYPSEPHCEPKESNVRYYREEEGLEDECTALYDYAAAAAAHRATQQDDIATGNLESSYMLQKAELVSDTELALSCSAAGLGLLFVWSMFRKEKYKRNATLLYTLWVLTVQVLSYFLEALPLHTALVSEIKARNWVSLFAFVDGTLALAKSHPGVQGSAEGSVIILTAVLGEVKYRRTRETLVASLTVFFDITALIVIVLTILHKLTVSRLQKRGVLPKATLKDPEFSSQLPSMQVPEILQPGTLLRAVSRRRRPSIGGSDTVTDDVPGDYSIDGGSGSGEVTRVGGRTTHSYDRDDGVRVEKSSSGEADIEHMPEGRREHAVCRSADQTKETTEKETSADRVQAKDESAGKNEAGDEAPARRRQ